MTTATRLTLVPREIRAILATAGNRTHPALDNVRMGEGQLRTTTLEVSTVFTGEDPTVEPFLVPSATLKTLVKGAKAATVFGFTHDADKGTVSVTRDDVAVGSFPDGGDVAEYPDRFLMNCGDGDSRFSMDDARELSARLMALGTFAAKERTRFAFNGLRIDADGATGTVSVTATNGKTLANESIKVDDVHAESVIGGVVPLEWVKAFDRIAKLPINKGLEASVIVGVHHASATVGDWRVDCRLLEGHFPSYRSVIPQYPALIARAPSDALTNALTVVAAAVPKESPSVGFGCTGEELTLTADSYAGKASSVVAGSDGARNVAGLRLDPAYVLTAVRFLGAEEVTIAQDVKTNDTPVVFTSPEYPGRLAIVMPVTLRAK